MKFLNLIACMAFVALAGTSVQANESAKLAATIQSALDVMYLDSYKDYTSEQRQAEVRRILEKNYDLDVMIRRSIARNWNLLNAKQQVRVDDLIDQLIVKSFVEGMKGHARPMIDCGDVVEVTNKRIEISVVIRFPEGKGYNTLYRFGRLESGWQIYDIVAENISIVSNYRQQFDDHFRQKNGAQLIEKLETLLKEERLDASTKI